MPELIIPSIQRGTILGFDFGTARIGVAVGEAELATVHPLETIATVSNEERFSRIAALIKEWQPQALVVGLPTHADGADDDATALCRRFGNRLHGRFHLPVYWVDERWTSVVADSLLREANVFGKKRKQVLDQVSAQAILSTFFSTGACLARLD
ncbi:Holliday junction resolvase RuvX [Snodgrassella alvi]|jgi:putative holliday junction resolvase|uniref:Putative pre-16S rRNA nuclease n=1 Tax=Snodgrassella alvi TaxID=1196083 RepID=A0A855FWX3_9NEIS|nr:Holliday junction DNA helicase RuvA [Snodgrassella alvi]PIT51339.1 Holliday junction DNA helicase RuvA [Snodgrassella alvi]PIT56579.1 Holliday junction DNA helicase RuvA [Snodgrassella alvi]PIT62854.1 Holliday junction DNA helicase RuvA [Snodgrassella alvi]